MYDDLTRLAIIHGTDKFGYHDYTPNYFKLFSGRREDPLRLLEIGVGGFGHPHKGGESLHVWQEFFPNAQITGIDIQKKDLTIGPRVEIWRGSQVDPDFLTELVAARGPFDIILDDGSHRNEHVVESYRLLFPTLNPGGIYVIEDTQTAFRERFGGSLEMTQPNSIGLFADIFRRLNTERQDPLLTDVAGIERYHNIVVLHKRGGPDRKASVFGSDRLAMLGGGAPPQVLSMASDPLLQPWTARFPGASVVNYGPHFVVPSVVADHGPVFDLAICESGPEGAPGDEWFGTLVETLADDGALIIQTAPGSEGNFDETSALMGALTRRFVEVDHREITHHFPDARIGPHAKQIYSIERFRDGVLIHKAANDYPSNFAFEAGHPQAVAVRERIAEITATGEVAEGGLLQVAETMRRERDFEGIKSYIARLDAMGAQSNRYFVLAGEMARRSRDGDRVIAILERALEVFPHAPEFAVSLAREYTTRRDEQKAVEVLEDCVANHPVPRDAYTPLAKLYDKHGRVEEAIVTYAQAWRRTPKQNRAPLRTRLAELMISTGDLEGAERELRQSLAHEPGFAKGWRVLSDLLIRQEKPDEAREAIARAVDLAPDDAEFQSFRDSLLDV